MFEHHTLCDSDALTTRHRMRTKRREKIEKKISPLELCKFNNNRPATFYFFLTNSF